MPQVQVVRPPSQILPYIPCVGNSDRFSRRFPRLVCSAWGEEHKEERSAAVASCCYWHMLAAGGVGLHLNCPSDVLCKQRIVRATLCSWDQWYVLTHNAFLTE